jgi:hypothetical protein
VTERSGAWLGVRSLWRSVGEVGGGYVRALVDGRVAWTAGNSVLSPLLKYVSPGTLGELRAVSAGEIVHQPERLAEAVWPQRIYDVARMTVDFAGVWETLLQRTREGRGLYPPTFAADRAVCLMVYLACRIERPHVVLETGVADGVSSYVVLRALDENGLGVLHSVDVRSDVGRLVRAGDRERWRLHILHGPRYWALRRAFAEIPRGGVFVHDSNHSYAWQRAELTRASSWLLPGGLAIVDDADASRALAEWSRSMDIRPHIGLAGTRLFGVARVTSQVGYRGRRRRPLVGG